MARKAKPRKKTRAPRKAPPKAAAGINEAALTKGELRKLNALRKSVGDKIAEQAFIKWLSSRPKAGAAAPRDRNAELITETLGKLVQSSGFRIPRGGYVVTRGRGRVIVTRAKA
jgi:hypothetical protein